MERLRAREGVHFPARARRGGRGECERGAHLSLARM